VKTRFGQSTPYSVGIEEEYQIVDGDSLQLVSRVEPILAEFEQDPIRSRIKPELLQSVVEGCTRIGSSVAEAVEDLADVRCRVRQAAAAHDAVIASAGTHPFARYDEQSVTARPRYAELADGLGWLAARQLVFGLHIHIGVSSAAKAIACADGLRSFLPELLALSANSPFWQGRATGIASTRTVIFGSLPRSGPPPVLGSFDAFESLVEEGVGTGCFPDYTRIWWDIRPHPQHGTVEVRVCDAQSRIESVAAIAALVQSLTAQLGSWFDCTAPTVAPPAFVLEENRWRAAHDGLDAALIDIDRDTDRSARAAIRELVERCEPFAEALGCADELERVEHILEHGNGADEQRRVYDETQSLLGVAQMLVDEAVPRQLAGR
jgi:glutamate---cysteine ligase / carboxylate-amine ligase